MSHVAPSPNTIPVQSSSPKLRVVFAGTPEFAANSLTYILEHKEQLNLEVVAVYTQPDRKSGRGQKVTASAVKNVAVAHGITVEQPATFRKSLESGVQARARLRTYNTDVMVVVAYGLILPLEVLNTPRLGCLNVHGSLLPRWRGAAPIHRAILAGDTHTGITIMQMNQGLDTGDMLYKAECAISNTDTSASLHDTLAELGAKSIATVLADVPKYQAQAEVQDESLVTYAEKLSKSEGVIDWTQSASHIACQIRGMFPYPSTFSFIDGKRVKIITASHSDSAQQVNQQSDQQSNITAGTVVAISKTAITVACGNSHSNDTTATNDSNTTNSHDDTITETATTLDITKLQFEGGKPLTAEQVFHSKKIVVGDRFDV